MVRSAECFLRCHMSHSFLALGRDTMGNMKTLRCDDDYIQISAEKKNPHRHAETTIMMMRNDTQKIMTRAIKVLMLTFLYLLSSKSEFIASDMVWLSRSVLRINSPLPYFPFESVKTFLLYSFSSEEASLCALSDVAISYTLRFLHAIG